MMTEPHFKIPWAKFTLFLIFTWIMFVGVLFNQLRLVSPHIGLDQYTVGLFANRYLFFVFLITVISWIVFLNYNKKTTIYTAVLLCIMSYSFIVGSFFNGINLDTIKHLYLFVIAIVFIELGFYSYQTLQLSFIKNFATVGFYVNGLSCFIYGILSSVWTLYPSFGTQGMGYVFLYFLVAKMRWMATFSLIIIAVQGKRSILLSVLFTYVLYRLVTRFKSHYTIFIGFGVFLLLGSFFFYVLEVFDLYKTISGQRFAAINPFAEQYDLAMGSSGRLDEYSSFFKEYKDRTISYFLGVGVGFNYTWTLSYRTDFEEVKSYLHNSGLMILVFVGPFLFTFIYGYILKKVNNALIFSDSKKLYYIALSVVYFIISGMFSLNILVDPLGYILLGALFASQNRNSLALRK